MSIYDRVRRIMLIRAEVVKQLQEKEAFANTIEFDQLVATYTLAAVVQDVENAIDLMRKDG